MIAVAGSLGANLAFGSWLWSTQMMHTARVLLTATVDPERVIEFRIPGTIGSEAQTASIAAEARAEPEPLERLSPTVVRVERDHAHIDKQMVLPKPALAEPTGRVPTVVDDHDHLHEKPHVHETPAETAERPATPPRKLAAASITSVAAAAAIAQQAGHDEKLPVPFDNPAPTYPAQAVRNGWRGTTLLRVTVGVDGRVTAATVVESSGHAILDDAAVASVQKWRFTPGTRDGVPTPFAIRLPIEFVP